MQSEVDIPLDDTIVLASLHARRKLTHVQAEIVGETLQPPYTFPAFILVYVQVVMVLPECPLLAGAFSSEGRQVRVVIDMREMEISNVH